MSNDKEIISEIRSRIQFLITIAIFFIGLLYYFYKIFNPENAEKTTLSFAIVIISYLVLYLCFESLRNLINNYWFKIINILTLVDVGSFLVPAIYLSSLKNNLGNLVEILLLKISLWVLLFAPVLTLLAVIIASLFSKPTRNQ